MSDHEDVETRCPTCDSGRRSHRGFPVGGEPKPCLDPWHEDPAPLPELFDVVRANLPGPHTSHEALAAIQARVGELEYENRQLREAVNPGGVMFDAMTEQSHRIQHLEAENERLRALVYLAAQRPCVHAPRVLSCATCFSCQARQALSPQEGQ